MRILLTGASGYLGSHVAGRLVGNGDEVCCILRKTSAIPAALKDMKKIYRFDYGEQLYEIVREIQPELVVHTAGMFLGEHTQENIRQLINSNVMFPAILADAANQAGCRCMVQTGSYWQHYQRRDYDPVNLYAATKQASEDLLEYYKNTYQWKILTLEIFDVFGPDDHRKKILNLVRDLKEGETLDLTNGEQKMYMCHIDDVAEAYVQAARLIRQQGPGSGSRYAVRGEKAYTLREVIRMYLEISGKKAELNWGGRPYGKREFMNPEGLGRVLEGWEPAYDLYEGLRQYATASWHAELKRF